MKRYTIIVDNIIESGHLTFSTLESQPTPRTYCIGSLIENIKQNLNGYIINEAAILSLLKKECRISIGRFREQTTTESLGHDNWAMPIYVPVGTPEYFMKQLNKKLLALQPCNTISFMIEEN